jgi:hypothetical protein
MAKRVPAWDARTGEKLPHNVPQEWFDHDLFPNLTDKEPKGAGKPAAPAATTARAAGSKEA